MAAGLSIDPGNLEPFRTRLNHIAQRTLSSQALQPELRLDAEVGLAEMTVDSMLHLQQLKPEGPGNPRLHFLGRNLSHQRPLQRIGAERQHVKMWITDGCAMREAVWWRAGNESLPVGQFDAAFTPAINEFNGTRSVQLTILDWQPARAGALFL
jgi:single-stranded-DNA-specific exonuclease